MHGLKRAEAAGHTVPPLLDWLKALCAGVALAIQDSFAAQCPISVNSVTLYVAITASLIKLAEVS
jgi:hypothetical protein